MGIKNLFKLISKNAPNSVTNKNISSYIGKYLILDANMVIYQYVIAIRNSGSDLTSSDGKITSHILGVISKTLMLMKNGIIPVFVFDGKAPKIKSEILKKRKESTKKSIEKMKNTTDEKEKLKFFKRSFVLNREQVKEAKEILSLFGVPVIEPPSEADPMCAELVKKKLAYAVISEDMDLLTFGSPKLIKKIKTGNKKTIIEIDLPNVLKELKLNMDEFIDLCILLGCDYASTISKVGMVRAYEIIKEYGSIDKFIEKDPKVKSGYYKIPNSYTYKEARDFFKNPPVKKVTQLKLKKPKYAKIKEVMVDKYNFKLEKVNEYCNKLSKFIKKHDF